MPSRWRRKFSALYDNVLESGLSDSQLATVVRLQVVLHRAWRSDPERYEAWIHGDAEKTLTLGELQEATGVASVHKARSKMLALNACDPYGTGALEIVVCPGPGWTPARLGRGRGARSDAQSVQVRWPKFSEVLNLRGPHSRLFESAQRPYQGRRTKNEARGSVPASLGTLIHRALPAISRGGPPYGRPAAEGEERGGTTAPSPGWDLPPGTPRLSELTEGEREEMRRSIAAARKNLRERSHRP